MIADWIRARPLAATKGGLYTMLMPGLLLAAVFAIASMTDEKAATGAEVIEIGEEMVDLSGAGELVFDDETDAIARLLPQREEDQFHARIMFDHEGRPLGCASDDDATTGSKALCDHLMRHARYRLVPGFDLPFRRGTFAFAAWAETVERPAYPIRFMPAGEGAQHDVLISLRNQTRECALFNLAMSEPDRKAICDAWLATGKPPHEGPVEIWVEPDRTLLATPRQRIVIFPQMVWKQREIRYLASLPPQTAYLTDADGRIARSLSDGDYPNLAIREDVEGTVKIVMGFERSGKAVSCRPVESSGTPFLDNRTCALMLAHAHYAFLPNAPVYSGTRYREHAVRWAIPKE